MYCNQCGAALNSEDKFCSKCGAPIVGVDQSATKTTVKRSFADLQFGKATKRSMSNGKAILIAVGIGLVPFVLLFLVLSNGDSSKDSSGNSAISATGDASKSLIKLAGEPDLIESSEYDNPRPPLVVKILTYKRQNVKVTFLADAPSNTPPPYHSWALVAASDAQTGESLPVDEFKRRMGLR